MTKNNRIVLSVILVLVVIGLIIGMTIAGKNVAKAPTLTNNSTTTTTSTSISTKGTSTASTSSVTATITLQRNYTGPSFAFSYPPSWSLFSISPFFMNNFNNKYLSGGIIPAGGAELAIVTTTISGSPSEIMATELMNATQVNTASIVIDSVTCTKATYRSVYAETMVSQDIAIYCQRGDELWKIYLAYPAGDANEKTSISDFNGMVASMKLTR